MVVEVLVVEVNDPSVVDVVGKGFRVVEEVDVGLVEDVAGNCRVVVVEDGMKIVVGGFGGELMVVVVDDGREALVVEVVPELPVVAEVEVELDDVVDKEDVLVVVVAEEPEPHTETSSKPIIPG